MGIMNVGFLGAILLATNILMDGEQRIDVIGLISSGLNIIMYGSPLSAMVRNLLLFFFFFSLNSSITIKLFFYNFFLQD